MTEQMNANMRGSVLASDPPEHDVLRGVLSEKLAPRALAKLRDEIGERADAIVAEAVAKGTFDAVTDLCARLPVEIVADLIGLPPEGRERLLPGSDAVFATFGPLDARMQARMPAFQSYFAYMMSFTDRSKLAPGSWGAAIWDAVDDGRIAPESATILLNAYLVAAMDTTVYALGSYLRFLAGDPQRWAALKADPGLIGSGFEETLRAESPVQGVLPPDHPGRRRRRRTRARPQPRPGAQRLRVPGRTALPRARPFRPAPKPGRSRRLRLRDLRLRRPGTSPDRSPGADHVTAAAGREHPARRRARSAPSSRSPRP
jgi:hypothetical protein